jgi:hypothetical protein
MALSSHARRIALAIALALWPVWAAAQGPEKLIHTAALARRGGASCDVMAPTCQPPADCRHREPCDRCQPPSQRRLGPGEEQVMREVGAYIAPPRTGAFRGPVVRRGFEGGVIVFPEIRLRLPSIEWPARYHSHSSARMIIDEAVAPWESHSFVYGSAAVAPEGAQRRSDETPQKRTVEDCERQLEECRRQLDELRQQYERLKHLEESLDKSRGPQPAPKPSPYQAPPSKALPGFPPAPVPDQGALKPLPFYPEAPASFVGEAAEPGQPERFFITEPRKPAARITAVRHAGL